jgi:cytochrome c-type biogenesis protein CcmH
MTRRTPLHIAVLTAAILGAAWFTLDPHTALGQGMHTGGNGTVEIHNETERQLFWSLICTCGCPRETLGTCPCDIATSRRNALRAMLQEGKTVEQAQDAYVSMYGAKSLAVPRNKGANRLLYVVPLVLIVAGAAGVVTLLKRWRRRGAALDAQAKKAPARDPEATQPGSRTRDRADSRDAYDDRLDQELKELDDE